MIRIGELKKVFTPVRHENLRALLRYSAKEFCGDDAFIIKTKKEKKSPMSTFLSLHFTNG